MYLWILLSGLRMVHYVQIIGSQTHQLKLPNRTAFLSLKIVYILANSVQV